MFLLYASYNKNGIFRARDIQTSRDIHCLLLWDNPIVPWQSPFQILASADPIYLLRSIKIKLV